jgi:hypothetical protein
VYVCVHQVAIFGMTQLSGKTTALEAFLIENDRSNTKSYLLTQLIACFTVNCQKRLAVLAEQAH